MALLLIEGFDKYGTTLDATPSGHTRVWSEDGGNTTTVIAGGRIAQNSIKLHTGATVPRLISPGLGSNQTMVVGFGYRPGSVLGNNARIVSFHENTTEHFSLHIQNTGELSVHLGTGAALATTSGANIAANTWCYIEFRVTIGNAGVGSYELWVGGVSLLSDANEDTQNGGTAIANNIRLYGDVTGTAGNRVSFDDLYIATGSTPLGPRKIVTIFPNAAGDSTQFTPSTGNNYQQVDDNAADDDTTYVESATSGHQDLYNFDNVSLVDIDAVQITAVCRETDASPFSIQLPVKSGGSTDSGSAQVIGSASYVARRRLMETNPITAAAWTDGDIDAAQFGIEVD